MDSDMDQAVTHAQDAYNDGYTHEALHAAHIACDLWDSHISETRCAEQFPDVKKAADVAAKAMYDVYQLIGSKFEDTDVSSTQEETK